MLKIEFNFSPNFKLNTINPENVIEAFKERIEHYYFKPLEILLSKRELGFAAITLLANLIDIFSKTENHDTSNRNNRENYTTWLENNLRFEPVLAKFFYYNFRCGLLHAGCIESGGQISYIQKELFVRDKGHLIINPKFLFQKLKPIFYNFIENEDSEELFNYLKERINEIN